MKYAIVGTGARHKMFRTAIAETYGKTNELVGLCDSNEHRLALSAEAVGAGGNGVATYGAAEFEDMLRQQKPDTVIVTVPDDLHHEYIVNAMRSGCDVICEKPMTIDLAKLKAIIDAQRETGRSIKVTFNYRYTPARTQIKDILMSGAIGKVTAIDFRWCLDRVHGADYFRRWHRYKERSGGLLVHKSTHHFDLVNWWLNSAPATVAAKGSRVFYTPKTGDELGLQGRGPRCHTCARAEDCPFELDLEADDVLRTLYLESETADNYVRDRCVFDEDISIEDTMQVQVGYENGATLNYTLCAYSPWEGLEITFIGTNGELTHRHVEVHGVFGGKRHRAHDDEQMTTSLHLAGETPQKLEVWQGEGDHGGADPVMLGYIFGADSKEDKYARSSGHRDGAMSILTGIAANLSLESNAVVDISKLLENHGLDIS